MKKLILILFALISMEAFSQIQIKEGSFKKINNYVMLDKQDHTDFNNYAMALIKITAEGMKAEERARLTFKGNMATYFEVKQKGAETYLYLTAKNATFVEILHPDYGKTEKYWFPEQLCDYCGYEMVVEYKRPDPTPEPISKFAYLIIKADQDGASIYIDDKYIGEKEVQKTFAIGSTHTWKIERDMYHVESGSVTINDKTIIDKKLRPNFGYIKVSTTPEQGAKVFVNGMYIGESPIQTDKLKSGIYAVRVMKDMYKMKEQSFTVTDGQTTNASLYMDSNFVDVTIKTDSQSDIYVDDEFKGKGKWIGKLSDGLHTFEAKRENHETTKKVVELNLGNSITINIQSPKPITGSLDVESVPSEADIYIDEKKYGKTPNFINEIIIGNHKLKIEKQGYATITKDITIKEGKILTIDDKLQIRKEQNSYYGLYKGNKKAPRYNVSGLKINWALYDVPNGSYIKPFNDGVVCFALRGDKNNSYGCIDRSGKIIIKPIYTSHFEFKDGIAVVEKNGKKGIIDKKGKQLLPLGDYKFIYEITECSNHGLYIVVNTDEKCGLFYNNELFIPCEYDALWSFNYPIIELKDSSQNKVLYLNIKNGEYYDFVYEVGDNVWAKKNNEYYCFEKGTGRVLSNELYKQNSLGYRFFYDEQSKKYGIVDSENKIIKEPSYFSLSEQFPVFWYKDRAIVISSDTSYMFLSESGDVLIKTEKGESLFWTKEYWTEEEEYIKTAKGKYGVDRKEGLYTIDGEQVFPTEYESIVHIYKDYFNIKKCDGEEYLHNIKTNKIYNAKVWYVSLTEDLMLEMSDGDNDFYLNLETDSVTSNYRITHPFSEGLAVVEDENYKKYIIDKNGNVILQENNRLSIYGDEFSEGVIWVYDVYNKVDGFIYNPLLKK